MENVYVSLSTPDIVQKFVETLTTLDGEFELISGKYLLDARSLMGIFSMDITKPIKLCIHNASETTMKAIAPFVTARKNISQRDIKV